jgi:1-acyl-sn-glycerol-3-phosphate acyltransferase
MQKVIIEEPYVHVPPRAGTLWPAMLAPILPWFLRQGYGLVKYEFAHLDRLLSSLDAGHGIMLMPNHCRDEDGLVMGRLSCEIRTWFYYMSSWHVFKAGQLKAFLLPRVGVFSVYREGADRAAVKTSVDLLTRAGRPVVIFPEGYLGRTNDRLNPLMEGAALIARSAAKLRAQRNLPGQVVIHPVALRYRLAGPLEPGLAGVLREIEEQLGLSVGLHLPLRLRLEKIEEAMQTKLETEQLGRVQPGSVASRRAQLIQALLGPLEDEWEGSRHEQEPVQSRVRRLRASIVPGLASGGVAEDERRRRWRQLGGIYIAQQLDNYPADYLTGQPPPERFLETVERLEEDLTDRVRPHVPLAVTVTIGQAIVVNPAGGRGSDDSLLGAVDGQLRAMLGLGAASAEIPPCATLPR